MNASTCGPSHPQKSGTRAAELAGLSLTDWAKAQLDKAARKALGD